jgi:F-type H+-transporting ATPase subunit delta
MTQHNLSAVEKEAITDVGAERVARVYAEALLNAGEKRNQAEEILSELEAMVGEVFRADPGFEAFLMSSAAGRDRKAELIRKVFEHRANDLVLDFLLVLNDHERLDLLRPIALEARALHNRRHRRIPVQVTSALPLPDDQRERLAHDLRSTFGFEPILNLAVDADLLGGLRVRIGTWLFDGSVRTQLETLRKQLIERSSYEIQSRRDRFSNSRAD